MSGKPLLQRLLAVCTLLTLALIIGGGSIAQAQSERAITVGLPEFLRNFPIDDRLEAFEAQNPGLRVEPVYLPFELLYPTNPVMNLDDHLAEVRRLAEAADVIVTNSLNLSPYGTRAGYFLDLAPLTAADTGLNPSDFLPAAWDALRWDNGQWGLPAKVEPVLFSYDPAAFDAAGLPYPAATWTVEDFANAARTLAVRNSSGQVTQPGLTFNAYIGLLLRALAGGSLIDSATGAPVLATPSLQNAVQTFADLQREGVIDFMGSGTEQAPLALAPAAFGLTINPMNQDALPRMAAPLPGGIIGVDASGFAVSAGTLYPQDAYNLVKFLTQDPAILQVMQGLRPARNSMVNADPTEIGGEGGIVLFGPTLTPEVEQQIESYYATALPLNATFFMDDAAAAYNSLNEQGGGDALAVLQAAEIDAMNRLSAAEALRGTQPLTVAPPAPEVVLAPGEVALRFGAGLLSQGSELERLLDAFVAQNPQVGAVELVTTAFDFTSLSEQSDCFYLHYNNVPSLDPSRVLALDPFFATDAAWNNADVIGGALAQVQRDGRTLALPIQVNPQVMRANAELFAQAGLPLPSTDWDINAFADALRALKPLLPEDKPAFANRGLDDSVLLALIAAYGGLPLDFRTQPVQAAFTDPANVDAIRQVLDLAKSGLIDYAELASNGFIISPVDTANPDALYSETIGSNPFALRPGDALYDAYRFVNLPNGVYTALAYELGTAYISANAANPDACYRLLRYLQTQPQLFGGVPALRSQFSNPVNSPDAAQFFSAYDARLQDSSAIVIPTAYAIDMSAAATSVFRHWLNQAFDDYVLRDVDLNTALSEAQTKADSFAACMAGVPAWTPENASSYRDSLANCSAQADPELARQPGF